MAAMVNPPEENTASRLVYHSWRTRFAEREDLEAYWNSSEGPDLVPKKEDKPIHTSRVNLPLPGGHYFISFEEFVDGWIVFFKDFPSIIASSDDGSLEDALDNLAEVVLDDFQIMEEYKDNVSLHLKKRHQFLKKVFKT